MIVHMNYQQYRTARRLVHSCCNYNGGCCLLLDNGEECVCPQSITYSLICKWFRAAVLPADQELHGEIMAARPVNRCCICGAPIFSRSNAVKYCPACAARERRRRDRERKAKAASHFRK